MMLLAIAGGIFVAAALIVRERQNYTQQRALELQLQELRENLTETQNGLRSTLEDLYVLRTVLAEHHLIDEFQLSQARQHLLPEPQHSNEVLRPQLLLSDIEVLELSDQLPQANDSAEKLH